MVLQNKNMLIKEIPKKQGFTQNQHFLIHQTKTIPTSI